MKTRHPENYVPEFSKLKFIRRISKISGMSKAEYQCECGNMIQTYINAVKRGKAKSCGCYQVANPANKIHGHYNHPLYITWSNMKSRCYNKNAINYSNYGGRGVYVCDEWLNSLEAFMDWALKNGWNKNLQIDKDIICKAKNIHPEHYSPDTCQFVTRKLNSNNRTNNTYITYNNETLTLQEWSEKLNMPYLVIMKRMKSNWPIDKALFTPVSRSNSGLRYKTK